ncbi:MAG TPA: ABC transporter permease [Vicinamibacterales bacterium]|nr:ABC transporter permease [Vicinamibacterales bacterium]
MKHSLRRLFKSPAFALTAIITVGAAIGANALIFSVVNGVILKPLPYAHPETLVGAWLTAPGVMQGPLQQSAGTYYMLRENGQSFEDIGLWQSSTATITGRGEPEQVETLWVTDATLPVLGIKPALGRLFTKEDDLPNGPNVVLISYRYWQRAFGGSPSAIGQTLMFNGAAREVVGVLPEDFRFLRANPLVIHPQKIDRATIHAAGFNYQGIARLKPGVSIAQANADVERLLPSLTERFPLPPGFTKKMFDDARFGSLVRPLDADVVGDIGNMLWILLGTVGLVLLVACANVANLFLVRAEARQQELAIRMALGAEARRVAWQLMSESLLVALMGGVLGIALAYGGIQLLLYLQPAQLPRLNEITLDPIVLLFTLGVSLIAGLLFGAIPILKYARPHMAAALKDASRGSSEGRERHRARNTLVVAQVALAAVLLVASGLMVRTFIAIRDVPPGFRNPESILTMRISIPSAVVNDPAQTARTHEQIVRKLEAIGGVESVGVTSEVTMGGNNNNDPIWVEDFPQQDAGIPPLRRHKYIADGYFSTMGNPVIAGRGITWNDVHTWASVALVSENLAREYWGEPTKALGKRIRRSTKSPWYEIVGVVGNERQDGATKPAPTIVYWAMLNGDKADPRGIFIQRSLAYVIRSSRLQEPGFLGEVQQAVWSVNPNLPLARVRTMLQVYNESMAQTQFVLVILGIAASVTLLLGLVGIYGVIAYVVSQRRREVGIRMALGAQGESVQRIFVTRGLTLAAAGLAIGLIGAAALMRLLSSFLFGVNPFDPVTYVAVTAGLGLVALIATWLPARQATRIDPMMALRAE